MIAVDHLLLNGLMIGAHGGPGHIRGENRGDLAHSGCDIVRADVVIGDKAYSVGSGDGQGIFFDFAVNHRHGGSPLQRCNIVER